MYTEKQLKQRAESKKKRLAAIPFGFDGGQELQNILDKGSATPEEMALLRDRRSYLTEEQKKHFGITEEAPKEEEEAPEVPEAPEAPKEPKKEEKPKKKKGLFKGKKK